MVGSASFRLEGGGSAVLWGRLCKSRGVGGGSAVGRGVLCKSRGVEHGGLCKFAALLEGGGWAWCALFVSAMVGLSQVVSEGGSSAVSGGGHGGFCKFQGHGRRLVWCTVFSTIHCWTLGGAGMVCSVKSRGGHGRRRAW